MEAYAGTMYDAVLLYALAVNETLESGKSIRNGLEVSKKTYNRVYEGMIYSVFSLDGNRIYIRRGFSSEKYNKSRTVGI